MLLVEVALIDFLRSASRQGERVRGPHVIECNASINRVKIRQYIHFPDGQELDFVVDSTTNAAELVSSVCRELKFHPGSAAGLSLYLETGKKSKIAVMFFIVDLVCFCRCEHTKYQLLF